MSVCTCAHCQKGRADAHQLTRGLEKLSDRRRSPWQGALLPFGRRMSRAFGVFLLFLVFFEAMGCATLKLEWTCPVPAGFKLEDTRTSVRCPTDGREVVVRHPKKKATP